MGHTKTGLLKKKQRSMRKKDKVIIVSRDANFPGRFNLESFLGTRMHLGKKQWFTKWCNESVTDMTWEDENVIDIVRMFKGLYRHTYSELSYDSVKDIQPIDIRGMTDTRIGLVFPEATRKVWESYNTDYMQKFVKTLEFKVMANKYIKENYNKGGHMKTETRRWKFSLDNPDGGMYDAERNLSSLSLFMNFGLDVTFEWIKS